MERHRRYCIVRPGCCRARFATTSLERNFDHVEGGKMKSITFLSLLFLLGGCTIGNWQICGPQTPTADCDKEAYEALVHPKPYGAHWVKEGMTRESRRADLAACGSPDGEEVDDFPPDQMEAARLPSDPNEINALLRLREGVGRCMQEKGYAPVGNLEFLWGCDERCLYP
jgi:hypothetical protein